MGARRTRSIAAWLLAGLTAFVMGAACIIAPEEVSGPCKQDSDCPDEGVPCTKELCLPNGFCAREPQDLPFGDNGCDDANPCTDELCQSGACAHQPSLSQPTDGNECTDDACVGGVATYTPVMNGTSCGVDGKLLCAGGKCNCKSATECGVSTECLKFECTNSECKSTSLEKGTEVDGKAEGDCLENVCDGANNVVTVPDPSDPPDDPTDGNCKKKACDDRGNVVDVDDSSDAPADDGDVCTDEGCNGGTPIDHEPVANGSACGNGPTCQLAAGGGYEAAPGDACIDGTCTTQAPVTCALYQCNAGNTACLGVCQGMGDCIVGSYCDAGTNACTLAAGTGDPCANQAECASGTTCVDGVCCNTECSGTCQRCNDPASKGICSAIPISADPDDECPDTDACNGVGACAKPQAATCGVGADCILGICEDATCCDVACSGACKRCDIAGSKGTCGFVDPDQQVTGCTGTKACDGNGGCKTVTGQSCGSDVECLSGFCQDGYCCNGACGGACARCDLAGKVGMCTNVAAGQQVAGCNATNACDGGTGCKKVNGQACNGVNDCVSGFCPSEGGDQKLCCNEACADTCKSCSGAKTTGAMNGICDAIKNNTDPDDECPGGTCNPPPGKYCCNGAGTCNP